MEVFLDFTEDFLDLTEVFLDLKDVFIESLNFGDDSSLYYFSFLALSLDLAISFFFFSNHLSIERSVLSLSY